MIYEDMKGYIWQVANPSTNILERKAGSHSNQAGATPDSIFIRLNEFK